MDTETPQTTTQPEQPVSAPTGSESSPAPLPSSPAPEASPSVDTPSSSDFTEDEAEFQQDIHDLVSEIEQQTPQVPPTPATTQRPAPPAQPVVQAPQAPLMPQAQQPVQGVPAAPVQQPQQPTQTQQVDPAVAAAQEAEVMSQLEQYYAVPKEWQSQLVTEPEAVLPKLAARVHAAVFQAVANSMLQSVPTLARAVMQQDETERQAEKFFYEGNEDLRPFDKQVRMIGATYRQLNPNSSREEAKKAIAATVRASLGRVAPPPAPAQQPVRQGFTPAVPYGGGGGAPVQAGNMFTQLASQPYDMDEE